jgi:hypothetical protein
MVAAEARAVSAFLHQCYNEGRLDKSARPSVEAFPFVPFGIAGIRTELRLCALAAFCVRPAKPMFHNPIPGFL